MRKWKEKTRPLKNWIWRLSGPDSSATHEKRGKIALFLTLACVASDSSSDSPHFVYFCGLMFSFLLCTEYWTSFIALKRKYAFITLLCIVKLVFCYIYSKSAFLFKCDTRLKTSLEDNQIINELNMNNTNLRTQNFGLNKWKDN